MECDRAFVIPESWLVTANIQTGRLSTQPSCQIIPIPDYEKLSKKKLLNSINKALKITNAQSAIVVLPTSFALGSCISYWPNIFMHSKSGILITSVFFSDEWSDCQPIIDSFLYKNNLEIEKYNVTCQYQFPYTDTLRLWVKAGAQNFHPGDYFKYEFLNALSKMQGHWLYWGHADSDKLRGYSHIFSEDILSYKPESPLRSTLWFTCATLDSSKEHNIALEWFLSGSTHCLLASLKQVKTKDNQLLSSAWLETCKHKEVSTIADIIYFLLKQDEHTFGPILGHYRLMGSPWIKFV